MRSAAGPSQRPSEDAARPAVQWERTSAPARRRVYRSLAMVVLVFAAMVTLTVLTRDVQDIEYCRRELQFAVARLAQNRDALPLVLPQRSPREALVSHYRYRPFNVSLLEAIRPIGVACCEDRHRLLLRRDGRHVLLHDGTRYIIQWVDEATFQASAETWGLATLER